MFGDWLEWLPWLLSLTCTGAAIKLLDDYLDMAFDLARGRRTAASKFGRATLAYAMVFGLLGAYINSSVALSVFLGSYAVGMFTTWREKLPSGLPAFVEIACALGISMVLVGWQMALWGLAMMCVIDWLDDLVDMTSDKQTTQANIAVKIGIAESVLLLLTALLAAVLLQAVLTALCFVSLTVLSILAELTTTRLWKTYEQSGRVRY